MNLIGFILRFAFNMVSQKQMTIGILIIVLLFGNILVYAQTVEEKISELTVQGKGIGFTKKGDGFEIKVSKGSSFNFIVENYNFAYTHFNGDGHFILDNSGIIVEAAFEASQNQEYFINGVKYFVPQFGKVHFKDGVMHVQVPENSQIKEPESLFEFVPGKMEITTTNGKAITLPNGKQFVGTLGYDEHGFFVTAHKAAQIGNFKIENSNSEKFYFDFKGEKNPLYPGFYLSYNENAGKMIFGTNTQKGKATLSIADSAGLYEGIGMFVEKNDHASWTLIAGQPHGDSYMLFERKKDKGEVTYGETHGYFENVQDNKKIFYTADTKDIQIQNLKGFESTSPMPLQYKMFSYDDKGNSISLLPDGMTFIVGNVQKGFLSAITGNTRYASSDETYLGWGDTEKMGAGLHRGVSNLISYNYPSEKNFETFTRIDFHTDVSMTPDMYRLLMDSLEYAGPTAQKNLQEGQGIFYRQGRIVIGGFPGDGWGGNGKVQIGSRIQNDPDYIIHELFHELTLSDDGFMTEWEQVSGKYVANGQTRSWSTKGHTSQYGSSNVYEDAAEFARFFIRSEDQIIADFRGSDDHYLNTAHEKLLAAKTALYIVKNKLPTAELNRLRQTLSAAGLQTDDASLQKFIDETKKWSGGVR
ncbi:MAG: hypothetical protein RL557_964 [archaeon]